MISRRSPELNPVEGRRGFFLRPSFAHVRFHTGGSTGRRDTGVKSLCGGFKLQGLTWPFVELTRHFVQIGLRVHRQVGALRKVLSQQAIGVLIRPALPRALRITEVNVNVGRQRKSSMIRKFLAPVPGQRFIEFIWELLGLLYQRGDDRLGVLVGHLRQHHVAGMTFDQGRDIAVLGPGQQIAFPMAGTARSSIAAGR